MCPLLFWISGWRRQEGGTGRRDFQAILEEQQVAPARARIDYYLSSARQHLLHGLQSQAQVGYCRVYVITLFLQVETSGIAKRPVLLARRIALRSHDERLRVAARERDLFVAV